MELKHIIESILFLHGESISLERLAKLTKEKKEEVRSAMTSLRADYAGRGVVLLEKNGQFQFGTNPENRALVENFLKIEFTE